MLLNRSCAILLILLLSNSIQAQDWVRLQNGKRIKGEIIVQNEFSIEIIDELGERYEIQIEEYKKLKKGKKLAKVWRKKLAELNKDDSDAIFLVAREAFQNKKTRKDGKRLLRRVLSVDENHPEARKLLGHFKVGDTWYLNKKKAQKSLDAHFAALGFVRHEKGWIDPEKLEDLKSNIKNWMIVEGQWRNRDIVMKERGYMKFRQEWIAPDLAGYAQHATQIEDKGGIQLEGSQVGTVVVLHCEGKERAEALATALYKARLWFAKTMKDSASAKSPLQVEIVVNLRSQMHQIIERCGVFYGLVIPREMRRTFSGLSHSNFLGGVHSLEANIPGGLPPGAMQPPGDFADQGLSHGMVNAATSRKAYKLWKNTRSRLPYFISNAMGVHGEIAAFGTTIVLVSVEDRDYGRSNENEFHGSRGLNLEQIKEGLKKTLQTRTMSLRSLFFMTGSQMDQEMGLFGVVFLDFLLQEQHEIFLKFLADDDTSMTLDKRFKKHFGVEFEKMDKTFRTWLN